MKKSKDSGWNSYTYVNYKGRNWSLAVRYGFISAGGGSVYSKPLKNLKIGEKIFVYMPPKGYIGYGIVESEPILAKDFVFSVKGKKKRFSDIPDGEWFIHDSDDPDLAEYVIKVKWVHTVNEENAVKSKGLFYARNVVARSSKPWWDKTVDILKEQWNIKE